MNKTFQSHITKYLFSFLLFLGTSIFCLQAQGQNHKNLAKPTAKQLQWQKMETTAFIHFSINTFTDKEWGYGNESPLLFNPTEMDCRQWVKICKDAGMKGIILTAKHHDGFCLWPSKYTSYSVKNSPWKEGKGDVLREFADACKEFDMKMGLYLSPWDCNHPDYGKPEYNTYFKNQLTEILTNYGDIFEIWFDGANGGRGYYGTDTLHTRTISKDYYNWQEFADIVHKLQPECIIHGGNNAEIRWVGNEEGHAAETHWSTMFPANQNTDKQPLRVQLNVGQENGTRWFPSETDVSLRPGWYYHDSENHKVKSLPKLLDIYYESVGRNSQLLLNLSPNKSGKISNIDSTRILDWRHQLDLDFKQNLIDKKTSFTSDTKAGIKNAFDNDFNTYWKSTSNKGLIEIDFGKEITFNRILMQEFIVEGQRIKHFTIKYLNNGQWINAAQETTIGYKRLLRLPNIKTKKIQITIDDALAPPMLSEIAVYNAPLLLTPPKIERDQNGMVTIISPDKSGKIFYTIDGKAPNKKAICYEKPFLLDGIATVKAIVISNAIEGELAEKQLGPSKMNWKIIGDLEAHPNLFDGNSQTTWIAKGNDPKSIVIDFNKNLSISGINYTPDQSRENRGIAIDYQVFISTDGENWEEMAKGEFSNIRNNPIQQSIPFKKSITARFVKFKTLEMVDDKKALGIAEFDVIIP